MATNVSYASGDTILESLVLHTLPDFGEHGDGIINTNFLLSYLKDKKRFKVVEGGLEFWKGVMKGNNSNFKWQTHTADMSAGLQDPTTRLRFDIKTFTGSIVINKLHEAQNKGKAMIKEFARTLKEQAESTIPNSFNSAFWAAAPAATEPESIPSLIPVAQTGTVGGVSKVGNTYLQNGVFVTAIADIGSEAGIAALKRQQIRRAIGTGGSDTIDILMMDDNLFAGLVAFLATQNRYRQNEKMAQMDFDTVMLGKTTCSYENTLVMNAENTITAGYVYGINSNHMNFECLKDGNFIWNPDGFERVGASLSKALYFWVFCNLTTNLPRAHLVCTNVSTT